jgi:hypothetical protein
VEVGDSATTAGLLGQVTATDVDVGDIWSSTGLITSTTAVPAGDHRGFYVSNGADIILTIATADITAGALTFHCLWYPLSADGNVVTA